MGYLTYCLVSKNLIGCETQLCKFNIINQWSLKQTMNSLTWNLRLVLIMCDEMWG